MRSMRERRTEEGGPMKCSKCIWFSRDSMERQDCSRATLFSLECGSFLTDSSSESESSSYWRHLVPSEEVSEFGGRSAERLRWRVLRRGRSLQRGLVWVNASG
jgi:hypothetical protein